MYLAREHTDASLPSIGRHFGGRTHTTVMYASSGPPSACADPEALDTAQALSRRLRAGSVPVALTGAPDRMLHTPPTGRTGCGTAGCGDFAVLCTPRQPL
jgi:hypothetical protein